MSRLDAIEKQVREFFNDEGTQQVLDAVAAQDTVLLRKAARAWANKAWVLPLLHRDQPTDAAKRMDARAAFLRKLACAIEAGDLV